MLVRIIGISSDTHSHVLTGHEDQVRSRTARCGPDGQRIEHSPRLRMRGLHVMSARRSSTSSRSPSVAPLARLGEFEVYDLAAASGPLHLADEPPTVAAYLDALIGAASSIFPLGAAHHRAGRSMVATTATTIYRVTLRQAQAITFVAVDGGMGDNLEVALFQQRFEPASSTRFDGPRLETVTVVGRHCESGDVLVDGVPLAEPPASAICSPYRPRAYCYTMNNCNGNRRIPVVFATDGQARFVVRRETRSDLIARDVD